MPYVNCPSCGLNVYAPRTAFSTLHFCPRCEAQLGNGPLFSDLPPVMSERVRESRRLAEDEAPARRR